MSHHLDRYRDCFSQPEEHLVIDYKNISPSDLADMLKHKDFVLIDVHIPEQAHIPGTDAFIPFNEISQRQVDLPQDKNAKIVLYCRSGSMSRQAAENLVKLGYNNVYNLVGGLKAWRAEGYSVDNKLFK